MSGFGDISGRNDIGGGRVRGGTSPSPDLATRGVAGAGGVGESRPFNESGLESWVPIAEAYQRAKIVTDANNLLADIRRDSDEIMNGTEPEIVPVGTPGGSRMAYRDGNGNQQVAIKMLKGDDAANSAQIWSNEMERRISKRLEGRPDWLRRYVRDQSANMFRGTILQLQRWGESERAASGVEQAVGAHAVVAATQASGEVMQSQAARQTYANNIKVIGYHLDGSPRSDHGWRGPQTYEVNGAARQFTEFTRVVKMRDGKLREIDMVTPDLTDKEMDLLRKWVQGVDEGVNNPDDFEKKLSGILLKAEKFAEKRIADGLSPYAPPSTHYAARADAVKFSRWVLDREEEMVKDLMIQSYGRMSRDEALKRARGAYTQTAIGVVNDIAESQDYDRAHAYVDALVGDLADKDYAKRAHEAIGQIKARHKAEYAAAVSAKYDDFESRFDQTVRPREAEQVITGWASDPELRSTDPKRAKAYADWAKSLADWRRAGGGAVKRPVDGKRFKAEIEHRINLFQMITGGEMEVPESELDGRTKRQYLSQLQRQILSEITIGESAKMFDGDDYTTLLSRFRKPMSEWQRGAMERFYRRLGVDPFDLALNPDGSVASSSLSKKSAFMEHGDYTFGTKSEEASIDPTTIARLARTLIDTVNSQPEKFRDWSAVDDLVTERLVELARQDIDSLLVGSAQELTERLALGRLPQKWQEAALDDATSKLRPAGRKPQPSDDKPRTGSAGGYYGDWMEHNPFFSPLR